MRRISRPCYDKPHRCPGWAGGGAKYPKGYESRCDNGSIHVRARGLAETYSVARGWFNSHPAEHPWRFGYCDTCNVKTWPWALVQLAPSNLRWRFDRIINRSLNRIRGRQ